MTSAKKKGGAGATAPTLKSARFTSKAMSHYRQLPCGSTSLAVHVISRRFRLSPSVAGTVVELAGFGRRS